MLEILITNDRCKVENIGPYIWKVVTKKLTFKVPGYYFSGAYQSGRWNGTKSFFERNMFYAGLLPRIIEILQEYDEPYTLIDYRKNLLKIEPIEYNYKVGEKRLRDYQVDAANSIINNKIGTIDFNRGILHMATNSGKTATAEAIMMQILKVIPKDKKILFVVPSKELLFQTKQTLEKDFPNTPIGTIGNGKWELGIITIALIPTLLRNIKKDKFKQFAESINTIIIDEVQHAASSSYQKVLKQLNNTSIRIGLTGTIPKMQIEQQLIFGATGTPTIRISNEFLISQKASARPICYFIEIRDPDLSGIYDFSEEYSNGIIYNSTRNKVIEQIVKNEREKHNSNILILVEYTEHGEIIKRRLSNNGYGIIDFTHGKRTTKDRQTILEDLKKGKINVLIATSVLDEGVDADNINVVIYARGQKSPRKLLQGLGRGLRKKKDGSNLRFYDFLDFTGENLKLHTLERYRVIKEEGFETKKISTKDLDKL